MAAIGTLTLVGCGGSSSDFGSKTITEAGGDQTLGVGPAGGDAGQELDGTPGGSEPDGASGGNPDGAVLPEGDGSAGEGGTVLADAGSDGAPGNPGDAAADQGASPSDAGVAADGAVPGHIQCGTSDCNEATQFCCVQQDGGASCLQSGASCGGARRSCEKASDCASGNVCCFDFSTSPASASCRGDCNGGGGTRVQACVTQAECLSGTCATRSCDGGGAIESCTGFAAACP